MSIKLIIIVHFRWRPGRTVKIKNVDGPEFALGSHLSGKSQFIKLSWKAGAESMIVNYLFAGNEKSALPTVWAASNLSLGLI